MLLFARTTSRKSQSGGELQDMCEAVLASKDKLSGGSDEVAQAPSAIPEVREKLTTRLQGVETPPSLSTNHSDLVLIGTQ